MISRWPATGGLWTAPQRGVIIILLAAMLVFLAIRLTRNPVYVPDPQPRDPPRAHELADRIDPNTADWTLLAALPMIGEKRARDIVAYREGHAQHHPGEPAFRRIEDLMRIKGFGTAMIGHLRPYLVFGAPHPPASQP
jgi:hypothetical protein